MFKKVAIVGVGLIGGSIGLALKKRGLAKEVVGIGRRRISIKKALAKRSIGRGTLDIGNGTKEADLIIVATPVDRVIFKIEEVAACAKKGSVIIDVNSTKGKVVRFADKIMPKGIWFVGTHPIAGSEGSSVLHASADLFEEAVCIVTPTRDTNKQALDRVKRFWRSLGAEVRVFSPSQHDRIVANISHLPHALSYSLCNSVGVSDLKVSGTGFRDTTRIAKSNPKMWADIFLQNGPDLLRSIESFQKQLKLIKDDIRQKRADRLLLRLGRAKNKRESIG